MSQAQPFAYIIAIDFNTPEGNYLPLYTELAKSHRWWRYLKSTWIVARYGTLVELGPKLRPLIYANDRLLIMPAYGPADGWLPKDAWDWITANVPRAW